ncbi:MAG: hypothetical protein DRN61_04855 [Thaumarchaeota archaeon]|nr:MAG: hypothetical protein DRN61_04855 [Nitrososphaerota archaeon]
MEAYDDDLYAWVYGGGRDTEYEGLRVLVFDAPEMAENFKKFSYGFQMVSLSVVNEALKGMGIGDVAHTSPMSRDIIGCYLIRLMMTIYMLGLGAIGEV